MVQHLFMYSSYYLMISAGTADIVEEQSVTQDDDDSDSIEGCLLGGC